MNCLNLNKRGMALLLAGVYLLISGNANWAKAADSSRGAAPATSQKAVSKKGGRAAYGRKAVRCSQETRTMLDNAKYSNSEIEKYCASRSSSIQVFETDVNNLAEAESYAETMKEYGCQKVAVSTERREGILWAVVFSEDCALRQTSSCPAAWDLTADAGAGEMSSGAKPIMPIQQRFSLRSAGNISESAEPSGGGYSISLCLSKEAAVRYAEKSARAERPLRQEGTSE